MIYYQNLSNMAGLTWTSHSQKSQGHPWTSAPQQRSVRSPTGRVPPGLSRKGVSPPEMASFPTSDSYCFPYFRSLCWMFRSYTSHTSILYVGWLVGKIMDKPAVSSFIFCRCCCIRAFWACSSCRFSLGWCSVSPACWQISTIQHDFNWKLKKTLKSLK